MDFWDKPCPRTRGILLHGIVGGFCGILFGSPDLLAEHAREAAKGDGRPTLGKTRGRAVAIAGGSGSLEPHYGGSIGASGVLCGLTGTLLCLAPRMRVLVFFLSAPLWSTQLIFVVGSVYCMATGSVQLLGHAGHLGGMAAGVAYYYGVARPWLRRAGRL